MSSPLDEALAAARLDPARRDAFYDLLLRTELLVPTVDAPRTAGEHRRAGEGETFSPVVLQVDGHHVVPAFDSERRLVDWAKREIGYIGLPMHALLEAFDPSLRIALNIGCEGFKLLVQEELAWLRERVAAGGPEAASIPAGSQVLIAAPKDVPPGLVEALRGCLAGNAEARAAHLALVTVQGGEPELMLVLRLAPASEAVRSAIVQDIGLAIRGQLGEGKSLAVMIDDGEALAGDIAAAVPPLYRAAQA